MTASRRGKVEVRAAGGVVWREAVVADATGSAGPGVEVVVIHRPRYDDWTFPKGKVAEHETDTSAAVREVEEETGMRCERGEELRPVRYTDRNGRQKVVRYWLMRVVGASPWSPTDEVDRRQWVSIDEARRLLTYPHDRELLSALDPGVVPRTAGGG